MHVSFACQLCIEMLVLLFEQRVDHVKVCVCDIDRARLCMHHGVLYGENQTLGPTGAQELTYKYPCTSNLSNRSH